METLGKPKEVLANFLRKEKALREGREHDHLRTVMYIGGGGTAAIEGLAKLHALSEHAPNAPDVVCGTSAGAAIGYAFLARMTKLGFRVCEHLTSANFIDGSRFTPRVKIDYVVKLLRQGFQTQPANQQAAYDHRAKFIVYATEYGTGKSIALDARDTQPDMVEAIRASMMIAGVCKGEVHIGGKRLADGMHGMPFPIRDIMKKYRPTDLLIILNRPLPERMGWIEWYLFPMYSRILLWWHKVPRPLRDNTAIIDRVMAREIRLLRRDRSTGWGNFWRNLFRKEQPVPLRKTLRWAIIAPASSEAVPTQCRDRKQVTNRGKDSYAEMKQLLLEIERMMAQE